MAKKRLEPKVRSKGVQLHLRGLMDRVAVVEKSMLRPELGKFNPGDTIKVHVRIKEGEKERIQIYEGLVIARSNRGASKSVTVRKISHGVGVERIFLLSSPKIAKIEIVQEGKVRRAKLYYIRKLEGKAARIERDIEGSSAHAAAPAAAAPSAPAAAPVTKK